MTQEDIAEVGKVDITKVFPTREDKISFNANGGTAWQDILIVAVPEMFANRGQFAKLGLWKWNDKPVVYVDDRFFYDQDKIEAATAKISQTDLKASREVTSHEKAEAGKWESKRRELSADGLIPSDPAAFKDIWIKGNPEAKELAYLFHRNSGDLRHLFEKYKKLLNWDELYKAFLESDELFDSEDRSDVNIAAGNNTTPPVSRFISETRTEPYLEENVEQLLLRATEKLLSRDPFEKALNVLDLMSGAHTYLSDFAKTDEVAGIGLNMNELRLNKKLNIRKVQDLNENPELSFGNEHFDIVLMTCGMAYLKNPAQLFKSVFRVLKPGGKLLIAFNNDYYLSDVSDEWLPLSQDGRVELTERWIASGGAFESIHHNREEYGIDLFGKKWIDIITASKPAAPSGPAIGPRCSSWPRRAGSGSQMRF